MSCAPKKLHSKLSFLVFLVFVFCAANSFAQKKKTPPVTQKKPATQTNSKNQIKQAASKQEKLAAEKNKEKKEKQAKIDEAKRREALAAKQKAILEEKRRREIAWREAQAKKLAFERSLRAETVENISNDQTEGEDLEIRRVAVSALGNRAGTVVVLEPQTGKVLTMVNQEWAMRKGVKPCSTIKLVTGVAGLNENLIDSSNGEIRPSPTRLNLNDALAYSNNTYFQKVGANLGSKKMIQYAETLGLGQPTGINAENEASGKLPFGNNNARIYSHGDDFEVTALQLAVMVSAISNGGKVIVPQIPKTELKKASFSGFMRRQISLPTQNLQGVIPGMVGAATYGTARRGMDSALAVAGKTGSCIGQGSWVGLFASVAPVENPQFAVIVVTRGQAERGKFAAGVAAQIYQALRNRITKTADKTLLAQMPVEIKPQPKVNAETAALLDDNEDEDSDDNATIRKGKKAGAEEEEEGEESDEVLTSEIVNVIIPPPTAKNVEKTKVKPATVVETFAPVVIEVKKSYDPSAKRPRIVTNR
jgi:penicillin-binding protein 2